MNDPILADFLDDQYRTGLALAERSDVLELEPLGRAPVQMWIARFAARGFVRRDGEVVEADRLEVGIRFGRNYLRRAEAAEVVTLLAPADAFHPNMRYPFICPGWLRAGTTLPDLLYQLYDIWRYALVTPNELDSLNPAACSWARANRHRFPIDPRPLARRRPS